MEDKNNSGVEQEAEKVEREEQTDQTDQAEQAEQADQEEEKKKKRAAFFFGGIAFKVIVVVLLAGIVALLAIEHFAPRDDRLSELEASVKAKLGQLENKTEEEVQEELNRVVEEGMFHVAINARPIFENGEAEGNLEIENVPNNLYTMRVEITLDDTGELVYNSGLVDPNYHIQTDKLGVVLEEGQYPATATFYAYDMQTLELVGTVSAKLTIYIKS